MAEEQLERLGDILGHRFELEKSEALLLEALTHPSLEQRHRSGHDYDRLEFLGDRVLGLLIARALFEGDGVARAGDMAVRFNALVRKETVAEVAREIGLGEFILLSSSEANVGGREKTAILANALEAVLGALYLDGGLAAAGAFIGRHWSERIAATVGAEKDPKTRLQEHVQRRCVPPPDYQIVAEDGPPHDLVFTVEVQTSDGERETGEGRSRRAAEQAAAALLLGRLERND